jgi:hypothetical protein
MSTSYIAAIDGGSSDDAAYEAAIELLEVIDIGLPCDINDSISNFVENVCWRLRQQELAPGSDLRLVIKAFSAAINKLCSGDSSIKAECLGQLQPSSSLIEKLTSESDAAAAVTLYTESIASKTVVPFTFTETDTCFSKEDGLWCKVAGCRITNVECFLELQERDNIDFDIDLAVAAFVNLPQVASQLAANKRTINLRSTTLTTAQSESQGVFKYIFEVMIRSIKPIFAKLSLNECRSQGCQDGKK